MFVFDGGVLTAQEQVQITLRDNEIREHRFVQVEEAKRFLRPYVWRRAEAALGALDGQTARYLHDGE